jgi:hypothetical protein
MIWKRWRSKGLQPPTCEQDNSVGVHRAVHCGLSPRYLLALLIVLCTVYADLQMDRSEAGADDFESSDSARSFVHLQYYLHSFHVMSSSGRTYGTRSHLSLESGRISN